MLKRIGALMLAAMFSAIVFGGCGAGAEGTAAVVSETGFEPPEEISLSDRTLTYQYTDEIPIGREAVGAGKQNAVSCTAYSYTDEGANEYVYDTAGRVKGYLNLSLDPAYSVPALSEEACIQAAEALAESLGVDLSGFTQVEYVELETGATVKYSQNPGTIYCSTASFEFVRSGLLLGFTAFYTDVDSLSEEDYNWFVEEVEDAASASAYADWPSVVEGESCYRVEDTLCYQTTITFQDEDGNKYPEIFFVSKPIE